MKLIYCLIILLCPYMIRAQSIKPITIGDKIPEIIIHNIINYKDSILTLSDLKEKVIILDFMATNCSSCLEVLPRFDSLQKAFADDLLIVLVSYQVPSVVKSFLQNGFTGKQIKLPVAAGDTQLSDLFPHEYISHEVWIKGGIVKAITETEYVNKKNIETVLQNTVIHWPVKHDLAEFDYSKPIFHPNEQSVPEASKPSDILYTLLTANMPDVPHHFTQVKDSITKSIKTSMINLPVIDLYRRCYGIQSLPTGNIILDVKDKNRYVYNEANGYRNEWISKNTWCYETVLPSGLSQMQRQQKMISDLDIYLGITSSIEVRKTRCLILVKSDSSPLVPTGIKKKATILKGKTDLLKPITAGNLVYVLNQSGYGRPVINESGYVDDLWLTLDESHFADIEILNKDLQKYRLQLTTRERDIQMLVIKEK